MNLMIDFETFATSNRAAVASLGYAVFDTEGVIDSGGWVINVASSLLAGGEINKGTVDWWIAQEVDAQRALSSGGVPIYDVMNGLADVWNAYNCDYVWSHGATFDIPLAEFYFQGHQPWKYSAHRDTRTLFDLASRNGWVRPTRTTSHIASQDAMEQAEDTVAAMAYLHRGTRL